MNRLIKTIVIAVVAAALLTAITVTAHAEVVTEFYSGTQMTYYNDDLVTTQVQLGTVYTRIVNFITEQFGQEFNEQSFRDNDADNLGNPFLYLSIDKGERSGKTTYYLAVNLFYGDGTGVYSTTEIPMEAVAGAITVIKMIENNELN